MTSSDPGSTTAISSATATDIGSQAGKPDGVVEGMEVFTDSNRCLARAKELSPKAGFQASVANTANMGFYKVDPSRGLCDIHFLATLSVPIADHEGHDSILDRQIALYCPCNGPWKKHVDGIGGGRGGDEGQGYDGSGYDGNGYGIRLH